jgi:tetratricopeptide (TPR) repeat protein
MDRRRTVIPVALGITILGGALLSAWLSGDAAGPAAEQAGVGAAALEFLEDTQARRVRQRFQQGVVMLQTGQFDAAVAALHEVLSVYPALPEAHVNMGYALLGAGEPEAAADFFDSATDLRPSLHNAYYGLALAERDRGNDEAALAAMQAYAHLAAADERHLPRASAFIRELQARAAGETP